MPDTNPQPQPQLIVQFGHAVGTDGVMRVVLQFTAGATTSAHAIDLDKADTAADQIATGIKAAAAEARRAQLGLVIPQLAVPNGHEG